MTRCYSVSEIRAGEAPLLAAQRYDDELMQQAAAEVAKVAQRMLQQVQRIGGHPPFGAAMELAELGQQPPRTLLLVGSGGNGGDALYAGVLLQEKGFGVDAYILGSKPHSTALESFRASGGTVLSDDLSTVVWNIGENYCLVIDGIVGIGGRGALREEAAWLVREAQIMEVPILAVDVPSGVAADTGQTYPGPENTLNADCDLPKNEDAYLPGHVTAAVTVTFGGLRIAHALSPDCGEVVLADIGLPSRENPKDNLPTLGNILFSNRNAAEVASVEEETPKIGEQKPAELPRTVDYFRAVPDYHRFGEYRYPAREPGTFYSAPDCLEPGRSDNKYSGGVTGIVAGSDTYPGAGVLCASGAVRATSAAVHCFGNRSVVGQLPTVILDDDIADARVDAWVVGPGRGMDSQAANELGEVLKRAEPVVIDADAITILSLRADVREQLRSRAGRGGFTILTPHASEFQRLINAIIDAGEGSFDFGEDDDSFAADPVSAVQQMSENLGAAVLLKGQRTIVAQGSAVTVVDSGSSWAATPGSGDVLAGLMGAWIARGAGMGGMGTHLIQQLVIAPVIIHAKAAEIAARTRYGHAPTDALAIAHAIPEATAWLIHRR